MRSTSKVNVMFLCMQVLCVHTPAHPRNTGGEDGAVTGTAQHAHGGWLPGLGTPAALPAPFSPCNQPNRVPRAWKDFN